MQPSCSPLLFGQTCLSGRLCRQDTPQIKSKPSHHLSGQPRQSCPGPPMQPKPGRAHGLCDFRQSLFSLAPKTGGYLLLCFPDMSRRTDQEDVHILAGFPLLYQDRAHSVSSESPLSEAVSSSHSDSYSPPHIKFSIILPQIKRG